VGFSCCLTPSPFKDLRLPGLRIQASGLKLLRPSHVCQHRAKGRQPRHIQIYTAMMSLFNRQLSIIIGVSALPVLLVWLSTSTAMHSSIIGALSLLSATATHAYCPPPGSLLPPPKTTSNLSSFTIPDLAFADVPWASDTSYAIKASIGDVTVFQYEYSAPGRQVGQSLLETKLRVGSFTKTFTMLAILLSADKIKLSDPITKFIPELNEEAYGNVTIAALASHTSGVGRYIFVGDLAIVPGFNPAALGLPSINSTGDTVSTCDPFPGSRVCTREEVIAGYNDPAYYPHSPNSRPMYSNIGYNLLGMALESVHDKTSEQVINDLILTPLNLRSTTFSFPAHPQTLAGSSPTSETTIPLAVYGPRLPNASNSCNPSSHTNCSTSPKHAAGYSPALCYPRSTKPSVNHGRSLDQQI
jgi:hypothetical protein